MSQRNKRPIYCELSNEDFHFLVAQLKAAAPHRLKGSSKAGIAQLFFHTIITAMKRPNHYPIYEIVCRMCRAAIPEEDVEGQKEIASLLT